MHICFRPIIGLQITWSFQGILLVNLIARINQVAAVWQDQPGSCPKGL